LTTGQVCGIFTFALSDWDLESTWKLLPAGGAGAEQEFAGNGEKARRKGLTSSGECAKIPFANEPKVNASATLKRRARSEKTRQKRTAPKALRFRRHSTIGVGGFVCPLSGWHPAL
jgi:hypothetical protein